MNDDGAEFFQAFGDSTLHLMSRWGSPEQLTIEDLYRHFKVRMLAEMKEEEQERERRRMDIIMKVRRPTSPKS